MGRATTGYGSAFGNGIKNAYPGKDFDDLMARVDALIANRFVDEQNMFVTGCSGGTAWTAHADAADRAVLQRAQAAQGADRDAQIQRRVARHDEQTSNFMRTQLYLRYWFDKYKRGEARTTTDTNGGR